MSFEYDENIYNGNAASQIVPYLVNHLKVQSVLDVGCGIGTWLAAFAEKGIEDIVGIDAEFPKKRFVLSKEKFLEMDLNNSFDLNRKFDIAICLELVEHLSDKASENIVSSLVKHSDVILFSAAIPYQGGQNHINEQWVGYWVEKFNDHGYRFYDGLRGSFWNNDLVDWWYKQNIFLISKNDLDSPFFLSSDQIVHPYPYERNSKELNNILSGQIGFRYLMSIVIKYLKSRVGLK